MNNEKKAKNDALIDPFTHWAHKTGRIFMVLFVVYALAVPLIMCAVYGCWPSFGQMAGGLVAILALMVPTTIAEVASYVPMLGSSTYLTFATGNLMNLKIPCAIEAQKVAKVEPNTTEGDAIALISTCVSSIVTIIILALGVLLMAPLGNLFQTPALKTASNYILPALFGCMSLGILGRGAGPTYVKNKLLIVVPTAILVSILALVGIASSGLAGFLLIVMIPLSILVARILWKKGIVKVVENPNYHKD